MTQHTVTLHTCKTRETTPRDPFRGVDAILQIKPPITVGPALLSIGGPTNMAQRITIEHLFSDKEGTRLKVSVSGSGANDLAVAAIGARIDETLKHPDRVFEYGATALI